MLASSHPIPRRPILAAAQAVGFVVADELLALRVPTEGTPLTVTLISNSHGTWTYSFDTTGLSTPSSAAGLLRDMETGATPQAWEDWSRWEMQVPDTGPVGDQAAPEATGPSLEKDSDAFWLPASPQRELPPPNELLPSGAVSSVFADWETNEAPILLSPEAATAATREAKRGDVANLAWAGVLAMMMGVRVPERQAGRRLQRVARKC